MTPLAGLRVVTTRERWGALDDALVAAGAEVIHIALIETAEPVDGGAALREALEQLDRFDRVVVTSRNGARRVADAVARHRILTAAVGRGTAAELESRTGWPVDLIPARQTAAGLVTEFARRVTVRERILVAEAEQTSGILVDGLRGLGHSVEVVIAYRTVSRRPEPTEAALARSGDIVVFASGSAVRSWVEGIGTEQVPRVCAIGPSTRQVAVDAGLDVEILAEHSSIEGVLAALIAAAPGAP